MRVSFLTWEVAEGLRVALRPTNIRGLRVSVRFSSSLFSGVQTPESCKSFVLLTCMLCRGSSGIEKCSQAFSLSLDTQRRVLIQEAADLFKKEKIKDATLGASLLQKNRPARRVCFLNEDLSAFSSLQGVTHLYSFDAAMEGPLIN